MSLSWTSSGEENKTSTPQPEEILGSAVTAGGVVRLQRSAGLWLSSVALRTSKACTLYCPPRPYEHGLDWNGVQWSWCEIPILAQAKASDCNGAGTAAHFSNLLQLDEIFCPQTSVPFCRVKSQQTSESCLRLKLLGLSSHCCLFSTTPPSSRSGFPDDMVADDQLWAHHLSSGMGFTGANGARIDPRALETGGVVQCASVSIRASYRVKSNSVRCLYIFDLPLVEDGWMRERDRGAKWME
ncbi:hypothetical protein AXG93_138s1250 [Marchantia polymorpha subsp. ruderalis]|uniref:Uncharacterized protein n=1 Tax=Marchantia polymorpha subsp. ruderalis TaxID=1480154 RepID=A0A176VLP7_MARPO|nr:hypothetical protein AXG93_138s1250 [Marchantia polymorpha subsp. ruderalis]